MTTLLSARSSESSGQAAPEPGRGICEASSCLAGASTPQTTHFVRGVIAYYTYISYTIYLVVLGVGGHGGGLACEGRLPPSLWTVLQSQRETEFRPSALGKTVVGAMRVGDGATLGVG